MDIEKSFFIIFLIFLFVFGGYFFSSPRPGSQYQHHVYLAEAFLDKRLDIKNFPEYYHDLARFKEKVFIPFPPAPAVILMPFVAVRGVSFKQTYLAMFIAGLNAVLVYLLFEKKKFWQRLVLILFYSFGTVIWYSAVIGTTWFYASICANFFLFLSLWLFLRKRKFFLSGLFFGLAALSRHPVLLGGVFFLPFLLKKKNSFLKFIIGLLPILLLQLVYNYLRFGNIFQEGYVLVYRAYADSAHNYNIFKVWLSGYHYPGYLDPRNIPAHLTTLFLLLPEKTNSFPFLKPSPYGMSIILTSPFFFYLFKADFKKKLIRCSLLAAFLVFIPISFHYMQGWVQFGYRFLVDLLPFLMMILADGLPKKISFPLIILLGLSIASNYFGVYWGRKLGW